MVHIITDKQLEALLAADKPQYKTISEALGHRGAGRLIAKKLSCGSVEFRFKYYRDRKQPVEIAIGRYQSKRSKTKVGIATAAARQQAQRYSQQLQKGIDPKDYIAEQQEQQRRAQLQQEAEANRGTFSQLLDVYVNTMRKDGRASWEQVSKDLQRYVIKPFPQLMKAHARDVEPEHITGILVAMAEKGLTTSMNRVRSYLHRAFQVGCRAYLDPLLQAEQTINFQLRHNPVSLVPKQSAYERVCDRTLSEDEILVFWNAMNKYIAGHTERLFKLLFALGGQRPYETIRAGWQCYDFQEELLILPKEITKNGREHVVPLNSLAVEILQEQVPFTGDCHYPFPLMRGSGYVKDSHIRLDSLNRSIRRCVVGEEMIPFTPRDIRRTCKTLMGKAGLSKDIRDRIHNHALTDVSSRHYDRYNYLKEKREALDRWDLCLRAIIEPGSNVVILPQQVLSKG